MYKWSKSTGKMKGIPSLNTDTTTNPFCIKMSKTDSICGSCYSMKMLQGIYKKNCVPAFQRNGEYLSKKIHDYEYLPKVDATTARFSSHGELINENHLINLLRIAMNQPYTTFTLFTKRKDLVNKVMRTHKKPKNMIFIFSNAKVDKIMNDVPKYFDKVFNVVTKEQEEVNCRGACITCLKCYRTQDNTQQIVEVIK